MKNKVVAALSITLLTLTLTSCNVQDLLPTQEVTVTQVATPTQEPTPTPQPTETVVEQAPAPAPETVTAEAEGPDGDVLDRARYFMEVGHMSKQGLINALVAEGWSYETAEATEQTIRPEYNYDHEAIAAAQDYMQYTPNPTRKELITYLHSGLGFTEAGSIRIVDTELGINW